MGPLDYHCSEDEDDGVCMLELFPTPVELIGGAIDGKLVVSGFSLDIERFRSLFDRVDSLEWQSLGFLSDDGPHVSLEGVFQGHDIFILILPHPLGDEEPGMKFDI